MSIRTDNAITIILILIELQNVALHRSRELYVNVVGNRECLIETKQI